MSDIIFIDAEQYYKAQYYGKEQLRNLREKQMFDTLVRLLKHNGGRSKAVVWAHNSHVGDASAMSFGLHNRLSLGQLAEEKFGKEALSLGRGTYAGTVAAAREWGGDMQIMEISPAYEDSYEFLAHQTGLDSFLIDLREVTCDEKLRKELLQKRLQRFIGVIYDPETERASHYSAVELPREFDGYIWIDKTSAVRPLKF
jgi:erythromycin esterase-like protein